MVISQNVYFTRGNKFTHHSIHLRVSQSLTNAQKRAMQSMLSTDNTLVVLKSVEIAKSCRQSFKNNKMIALVKTNTKIVTTEQNGGYGER
jgi:hypothetical protein